MPASISLGVVLALNVVYGDFPAVWKLVLFFVCVMIVGVATKTFSNLSRTRKKPHAKDKKHNPSTDNERIVAMQLFGKNTEDSNKEAYRSKYDHQDGYGIIFSAHASHFPEKVLAGGLKSSPVGTIGQEREVNGYGKG